MGRTTLLARPYKGAMSGLNAKKQICHKRGKEDLRESPPTTRATWCSSASNLSYTGHHREDTTLKHHSMGEYGVMDCRQQLK